MGIVGLGQVGAIPDASMPVWANTFYEGTLQNGVTIVEIL
jgi:hypothetical protein